MSPWLIILITLLFSAFFSGMEIAFVSSNKLRVELDKKQGSLNARIIAWFAARPEHFIATMLVGNNISLVIYGLKMAGILEPVIHQWVDNHTWVLVIQTVVATALILITAEFLPKVVFRLQPNTSLQFFAPVLILVYIILYPITLLAIGLSSFLLKRVLHASGDANQKALVFGKIDLDHLINQNQPETETAADMDQKIRLFQNALDFSNVRLRDCMIPRTEIEAIDVNSTIDLLKQMFIETGFSRILIYDDQIDHIIGYTHHSDLFKNPADIRTMVRHIPIVPETMPANKLLSHMLAEKLSVAVVVDEFGGTAGLVTTEDILEEIFGDIEDEHDHPDYVEKQVGDHEYRFSGRLEIDYLNENYPFILPVSEEYETLAGLIIYYHSSIPKVNETIMVGDFSFKILKSSQTRIELVDMRINSHI